MFRTGALLAVAATGLAPAAGATAPKPLHDHRELK